MEKKYSRRRGAIRQKAVKAQKRAAGYIPVLLAFGALIALAIGLTTYTQQELLSEEIEDKLLDFQHKKEHQIVDKTAEVIQQVQRMTGVGAGVMGNTAPKYTGKTMLTVTVPEKPAQDIYLRGFVGVEYENGCWYERKPFLKDFSEEKGMDVLSEGYVCQGKRLKADYEDVTGLQYVDMRIKYSGRNRDSYALMPYDSLYDNRYRKETMEGRSINADLNVRRKMGIREYEAFCYIKTGDTDRDARLLQEGDDFLLLDSYYSSDGEYDIYDAGSIVQKDDYIEYDETNASYRKFVQEYYCQVPAELTDFHRLGASLWDVYKSLNYSGELLVSKIQMYLQWTADYSLDLSSKPFNQDYVENFLFTQKKGFCEHFATAGTLLLREMGVPARYVAGYRISPDEFKKNDDGTYTAEVPDSDAHAWAEVYHSSRGWIREEMTPAENAAKGNVRNLGEQVEEKMNQNLSVPTPASTDRSEGRQTGQRITPAPEKTDKPTENPEETASPEVTSDKTAVEKGGKDIGTGAGIERWLRGFSPEHLLYLIPVLVVLACLVLWQYQHSSRMRRLRRAEGRRGRLLAENRLFEDFLRQNGYKEKRGKEKEQEWYVRFLGQIDQEYQQRAEALYRILEKAAFARDDISQEELSLAEEDMLQIGQNVWEKAGHIRKIYLRFIKNWRTSLTNKGNHSKN